MFEFETLCFQCIVELLKAASIVKITTFYPYFQLYTKKEILECKKRGC